MFTFFLLGRMWTYEFVDVVSENWLYPLCLHLTSLVGNRKNSCLSYFICTQCKSKLSLSNYELDLNVEDCRKKQLSMLCPYYITLLLLFAMNRRNSCLCCKNVLAINRMKMVASVVHCMYMSFHIFFVLSQLWRSIGCKRCVREFADQFRTFHPSLHESMALGRRVFPRYLLQNQELILKTF